MTHSAKATNVTVAARVSEIIGLLASGATRGEILQYASKTGRFENRGGEPWGVVDRTVDEYIRRAYLEFRIETKEDVERERKRAHMRYSTVYSKAVSRGKFEAAVSAERARCQLLGLNSPEKVEHSGKGGGAIQITSLPDEKLAELLLKGQKPITDAE